jgi:hypothetical protein
MTWPAHSGTKRAIMLGDADNRCSVRLANIGSGERRWRDSLALSLNYTAHAVVDLGSLDVLSTLFESGVVPGDLAEQTASLPAMSGPRQDDVTSCVFCRRTASKRSASVKDRQSHD